MKKYLIAIEGVDGVGKTTIMPLIKQALENNGASVLLTREPGGCVAAEKIRELIVNNHNLDPWTILLLILSARFEHIKFIKSTRADFIVCDRFIDSTLAYQAYAMNLGAEPVWRLIKASGTSILPDLTILLDADTDYVLSRKKKRNNMDKMSRDFYEAVKEGYYTVLASSPDRFVMINTRLNSSKETLEIVMNAVYRRFALNDQLSQ